MITAARPIKAIALPDPMNRPRRWSPRLHRRSSWAPLFPALIDKRFATRKLRTPSQVVYDSHQVTSCRTGYIMSRKWADRMAGSGVWI